MSPKKLRKKKSKSREKSPKSPLKSPGRKGSSPNVLKEVGDNKQDPSTSGQGEKSQNGGNVETGRSKWHKGESKAAELNKKIQERKGLDTKQMTKNDLMNAKFLAVAQKVKTMAALSKSDKEAIKEESKSHLKNSNKEAQEDSSSSESDEEDEGNVDYKTYLATTEVPPEFWQVQKLIRYLKIGNQTATIIALCNLVDFDLQKEAIQVAIMDAGGLEVLTNLLETDDLKCKIGSLKVLSHITFHSDVRRHITIMGGIELAIRVLSETNQTLQLLCTETIANLAKFRKARRLVRRHGGVPRLVDLLDIGDHTRFGNLESCADDELPLPVKVARGSAFALWSLSKSERNKAVIKKSGGLPLLAGLVRMKQTSILIPVIGTLQECATDQSYRQTMQSEGLMEDLVANLRTASPQLKMLCAKAIFRLAEEEESRHLVKVHGGLEPLVELIKENKDNTNRDNKLLMAAVTGALWKVSHNAENVDRLEDLGIVPTLIKLLVENSQALDDLQFNPTQIDVLTNVVGALAETAKIQRNRDTINNEDGLAPLIRLIATNHPALLVNVSAALGQCAEDKMSLKVIHDLDGVRLLWSLLKNPSARVQASAAWALSPCIQNASNSGDMVRGFVGGLELICGLLESDDTEVLAAVCYAIANIAKDKENLAVISDHGVIEKLSNLTQTENDMLRAKLALAIGNCCEWAGNRALFGKSGAVAPLVSYLQSSDLNVHITTTLALFQLSKDPWNCVTMHQHGVVTHLLRLIGSDDEAVQEAAADCLQNIRKLALACEKFRYQHLNKKEQG